MMAVMTLMGSIRVIMGIKVLFFNLINLIEFD